MPVQDVKTLKELPKKEIRWVHAIGFDGESYHITSAADRSQYFLYKETPKGYVRLAKDKTPVSFDSFMGAPEEDPPKKTKRVQKSR